MADVTAWDGRPPPAEERQQWHDEARRRDGEAVAAGPDEDSESTDPYHPWRGVVVTSAGAVPDLTAARVQRELFEQSLRGDLINHVGLGPLGPLDELTDRIMTNPHLAGWVEAVRVAERAVERRRTADLFEQNRDALTGFAGDKDRLVGLISHLLRLPSEADR